MDRESRDLQSGEGTRRINVTLCFGGGTEREHTRGNETVGQGGEMALESWLLGPGGLRRVRESEEEAATFGDPSINGNQAAPHITTGPPRLIGVKRLQTLVPNP